VFGVSADSAESHRRFKAKHNLPTRLLVDEDHSVCASYGVWVEKNTFGMKRMGIARTTFVIAPDGSIARVFEKVDPTGHGDDVANAITELRTGKRGGRLEGRK
jgi:peroxiredoxin Q/BCP